jgi:hypothetical protein
MGGWGGFRISRRLKKGALCVHSSGVLVISVSGRAVGSIVPFTPGARVGRRS